MSSEKKLRVGVIYGGRSGEHEVSLMSARSVLAALNPERYTVTEIAITHAGAWITGENLLQAMISGKYAALKPVALLPDPTVPGLYAFKAGEHVQIRLQHILQCSTGGLAIGLEINEQGESRPVWIDSAMMGEHPLVERFQVKRLEGALRPDLPTVMRNQQASIHQVNICFHTAKAVVQGVEQGPFVFVIIMGMRVGERFRPCRNRIGSPAE